MLAPIDIGKLLQRRAVTWHLLSIRSARIVPQRDIDCSKMALATNSAVGAGSAVSSSRMVWWSISTSMWVYPLAVGPSEPKMPVATIWKGAPIGRLIQRHAFQKCMAAATNT